MYKSALVFIPTCALLEAYKHELPAVHMTSPRTKNWDASLLVLEGHKSTFNMVSFSPKGGRAASASDDGYLYIWDTANGAQVNSLFGHDGAVKSIEYSPDASFLVSGGSDAAIRIWDAVTGAHIFTLIGHKGGVNAAIYSGDGRKIASGSDDETVGIWDAMPNKQLASLHGHSGPVTCLAFLTEDSHVLSGSMDATIRLWDTRTKNTLRVLQCPDAVLSLYVYTSLQNSAIISGSQNGVITIRDGTTLEETGLFFGSAAAVKSLSASSQVNKVVSGSSDGSIRVWDHASGSCVAEYRGHSGPVECTRFTPDGMHILSSSTARTVRLWDATAEGVQGSEDYIMVVQIPKHIRHIVSGSTHGKIALWKVDDGKLMYDVDVHHGTVLALACTFMSEAVCSILVWMSLCNTTPECIHGQHAYHQYTHTDCPAVPDPYL